MNELRQMYKAVINQVDTTSNKEVTLVKVKPGSYIRLHVQENDALLFSLDIKDGQLIESYNATTSDFSIKYKNNEYRYTTANNKVIVKTEIIYGEVESFLSIPSSELVDPIEEKTLPVGLKTFVSVNFGEATFNNINVDNFTAASITGDVITSTESFTGKAGHFTENLTVDQKITGNNIEAIDGLKTKNLFVTGKGDITGVATVGSLVSNGSISGTSLSTSGNISTAEGNISATAGKVTAKNIEGTADITTPDLKTKKISINGTGNLEIVPSVTFNRDISAQKVTGTGLQVNGNGSVTGSLGVNSLSVTETVSAKNISASENITATGNITGSNITATNSIITDSLKSRTENKDISVTSTISSTKNIKTTGDISSANVSASTSGSFPSISVDIVNIKTSGKQLLVNPETTFSNGLKTDNIKSGNTLSIGSGTTSKVTVNVDGSFNATSISADSFTGDVSATGNVSGVNITATGKLFADTVSSKTADGSISFNSNIKSKNITTDGSISANDGTFDSINVKTNNGKLTINPVVNAIKGIYSTILPGNYETGDSDDERDLLVNKKYVVNAIDNAITINNTSLNNSITTKTLNVETITSPTNVIDAGNVTLTVNAIKLKTGGSISGDGTMDTLKVNTITANTEDGSISINSPVTLSDISASGSISTSTITSSGSTVTINKPLVTTVNWTKDIGKPTNVDSADKDNISLREYIHKTIITDFLYDGTYTQNN